MALRNKILKKPQNKDILNVEEDSLQYNRQDLDQEQTVDVNPVQFNTNNLHVYIDSKNKFAGKITGATLLDCNKKSQPGADICLFFGQESEFAVYKTKSDENGNFIIDEIPPGYYILSAAKGAYLKAKSGYIKVLPGQSVEYNLLLK